MRWRLGLVVVLMTLNGCGGGGGDGDSGTPAPSALSYPSPQTYTVGQAISNLTPTVTGTVTSYSVSPALPAGLQLNSTTGALSGTPTAVVATATYTVSASNQSGSTSAGLSLTVNDTAPAVAYANPNLMFVTGVDRTVTPTSTGGAVVTWSINPAALPDGLAFNASNGSIGGTPTGLSTAASYTVTAQNSGGQVTRTLMIGVESGVLIDLGHTEPIVTLRRTATRLLSQDTSRRWVLWDAQTAQPLARGEPNCSNCGLSPHGDLAGSTFVVRVAAALEVREASDGHLLATVPVAPYWWRLAPDGSYLAAGTRDALTVWSRTGATLFSYPGNYERAVTAAAASELRVAKGAAGDSVIETFAVPSGARTVGPAFVGTFHSWFRDGERFFTTVGNTASIYSKDSVQEDIKALPGIGSLGGAGDWFWNQESALQIYKVGASATPAASYADLGNGKLVPSGLTLGVFAVSNGPLSIIDLSGVTPVRTNPPGFTLAMWTFGALSATDWNVGSDSGVVSDPNGRFFSLGEVNSITAGAHRVAIATAGRKVIFFNADTRQEENRIDFLATKLILTADGSTLAAQGPPAVHIMEAPSGTTIGGYAPTREISFSESGNLFGSISGGPGSSSHYTREVLRRPGGIIWSDTVMSGAGSPLFPIRLSPDDTLIAVAAGPPVPTVASNIYKNGVLVAAAPGWAAGWIDNTRLLLNTYKIGDVYQGYFVSCAIVDPAGRDAGPCKLPFGVERFQTLSADTIYASTANTILSLSTGEKLWQRDVREETSTREGAVAAGYVFFAAGGVVRAEPY